MATPFADKPQARINLSVSPGELLSFANSIRNADRISFRNGMITFVANETIAPNALGWTQGVYPTVMFGQADYVFNHEAIHVVQNIQMMSISPELTLYSKSKFRSSRNAYGMCAHCFFIVQQNYETQSC